MPLLPSLVEPLGEVLQGVPHFPAVGEHELLLTACCLQELLLLLPGSCRGAPSWSARDGRDFLLPQQLHALRRKGVLRRLHAPQQLLGPPFSLICLPSHLPSPLPSQIAAVALGPEGFIGLVLELGGAAGTQGQQGGGGHLRRVTISSSCHLPPAAQGSDARGE